MATTRTLNRLRLVCILMGWANSTLYEKIRKGLFVPPVKLGSKASAWPSDEVAALQKAYVAGWSQDDLRNLVSSLVAARTGAGEGIMMNKGTHDPEDGAAVSQSRAEELARWAKSFESPITWEPPLRLDKGSAAARNDHAWFEAHPERAYRVRRPLEGDDYFGASDSVLVHKACDGYRRIVVRGFNGAIIDNEYSVSLFFFMAQGLIAARRADGHGEASVVPFADMVELFSDPVEPGLMK